MGSPMKRKQFKGHDRRIPLERKINVQHALQGTELHMR
jgi:hypothetical protein